MKISELVALFVLTLGMSVVASAKEFRIPLSNVGENADGNFTSLVVMKNAEETVLYELVPATTEVATVLKSKKCPDGVHVDASVVLRTLAIDEENHRMGQQRVTLLVRKIECLAP